MQILKRRKIERYKKRVTAMVLVLSVILTTGYTVRATKLEDAQNKKDEAEEGLETTKEVIEQIEAAQGEIQAQMDAYDEELMYLLTDMELLSADIEWKQQEIDQAYKDLEAAEKKEAEQYQAMKTRIQYMYENGDTSIWEMMVGVDSLTDLLNRYEYVNEVYNYDRDQLTAYQETVAEVVELKEQFEIEKMEMEELEISLMEQATYLESLISQKNAEMENFSAQLVAAQNLASQYAKTIKKQNQIIAEEEARIAAEKAAAEAAAAAAEEAEKGNNTTASNGNNSSGTNNGSSNSSTGGSIGSSSTGLTDTGLNPAYTTNVKGSDVVNYACQFVGNPYVYGGTSLTEGCDCSYFVMACFAKYGISLPRSSYAMQKSGQAVSYDCAKAGDIICYSGHVALYMGDGKIVHASSPSKGICYGTATYRTIVTIRRVL